jgi:hypothetical protein
MRISVVATAVYLFVVGISTGAGAGAATRQPTNIAAQELAPALQTLAEERGVQVVYRSELVLNRWTRGANGDLTFEEALAELLKATGLTYRYLADKAITIVPVPAEDSISPVRSSEIGGASK